MTVTGLHRGIWAAGLGAAAVLFAQTWSRAARPGGIDLTTYLSAARALADGANPYGIDTPFPYLYPAFLAFVMVPLTWLPEGAVLAGWFAASIAAALWSVATVIRTAFPELHARPLTPLVATLCVLAVPVLQSNLRNGQVNLLLLALCVVALRQQRAAPIGGAAWAASVATKIVPAILGLFYVRRLAWRTVAVGMAAVVVMAMAPALAGGTRIIGEQREALQSLMNGSFAAVAGVEPLDFSAGGMVVALGLPIAALWLRGAAALMVVALVFAVDLAAGRDRRHDASIFALYLAAIPLVSPKSEVHHLAFALPAAAVVGARLWFGVAPRLASVRWLVGAALAAYGLAFVYRPVAGAALFASIVATAVALAVPLMNTTSRAKIEP